jgi:hypothetical protein
MVQQQQHTCNVCRDIGELNTKEVFQSLAPGVLQKPLHKLKIN